MKKELGQYMTPEMIVDFMISLIENEKKIRILEPSSGDGAFIDRLLHHNYEDITAFEIDQDLIDASTHSFVQNKSFVSSNYENEFDLVIGNPPYIRWKNLKLALQNEVKAEPLFQQYLNSLVDYSAIFILKSIVALKEGGELIFITPDYWLDSTHSDRLRDYMAANGQFSDIFLLKETKIFKNATVSLMIFRYVKTTKDLYPTINIRNYPMNRLDEETLFHLKSEQDDEWNFPIPQFEEGKPWRIFNDRVHDIVNKLENVTALGGFTVGDMCEIGNGMVSGLDRAFQIPEGAVDALSDIEQANTLDVIKGKDLVGYWYKKITKYIFIRDDITEAEFKKDYPVFYEQLLPYKERLTNRYNYNREIHYWDWVFLRNYQLFSLDMEKIFVPGKDRISHKDFFRFTIVPPDKYPTQDVTALVPKAWTRESIEYITGYLNSYWVFEWLKNNGIMKGHIVEFSHKPVRSIPYLAIDFDDSVEVQYHQEITQLVKETIINEDKNIRKEIDQYFDELIDYKLSKG